METDMNVETHEQSLDVPFLVRVIELFESVKQPDFAIKFAFAALQETSKYDNASQAFLWSVVFKCSLALKDYEQAYLALLSNPNLDISLYAFLTFQKLHLERLTLPNKLAEICCSSVYSRSSGPSLPAPFRWSTARSNPSAHSKGTL